MAHDHLVGSYIGNFRIERVLGEGAMGAVYVGVHDTIGRRVAIKLLHPDLARSNVLVERFIDEARAVSQIGHPGLVQVQDFGVAPDGRRYSIMELLEGEDLEAVLRREGRLGPVRAARLIAQVADAVAAAHTRGIVHRDLKPANLFVTHDPDGRERVKVLDWGIAKLQGVIGSQRTQAGSIVGTPAYLSPEQASGADDLDARADVYALGVVLYELISGRPPFSSQNPLELLLAHAHNPAPPLGGSAPGAPPELCAVVMRCLEKDRGQRFPTMRALEQALTQFVARESGDATLAAGTGPGSYGGSTFAGGPRSRSRVGLAVGAALLVVAAIGVGIFAAGSGGGEAAGTGASGGSGSAGAASSPPAPTPAAKNPFAGDDAQAIAAGRAVWVARCARCHGESGEGDGKDTPAGLEPKSFDDAEVTPGLLDLYRYTIVRTGIKKDDSDDFAMPSFAGELSEVDTWRVVTFVGTLAPPPTVAIGAGQPSEPRPAFDRALVDAGAKLWRRKCVSCHGKSGRGNGPARELLGRYPADLTRGTFKLRSTPKDELPTDEDLFRTLSRGMGVGGMPAFVKLSEHDRWSLVAYVETLSPGFAKRPAPTIVAVPPRPGPTAQSIERGHAAFRAAGCGKCHGDGGRADGAKASHLKDARGNPVAPPDFAQAFLFIGGAQPEDVYRTMMTGVAGTPMPQGIDFFDEGQEAWDVVDFIVSVGGAR